jgi:hypothetical protein
VDPSCPLLDPSLTPVLAPQVTYTTVVANATCAAKSVALMRREGLLDRLGLHLNLTEGAPLADPLSIPSLLLPPCIPQPGTRFRGPTALFHGKHGLRHACKAGEVKAGEAAIEATAQIKWFTEHVGRPPSHVNSHQHCHVIPSLQRALAQCFSEGGVKSTRISAEHDSIVPLCATCDMAHLEAEGARPIFAAEGNHSMTPL